MKYLYCMVAMLIFMLSACNYETDILGNFKVSDQAFVINPETPMFFGIVDSAGYHFDTTVWQCVDGFVYDSVDTSISLIGQDQVPAVCEPEIYHVVTVEQSRTPVYGST